MAATLAAGLRPSSRSAMKMRGQRVPTEEALLALLRDEVLVLIHQQSGKKLKQTDLISDKIINGENPKNIKLFAQGDDFLAAWEALNV